MSLTLTPTARKKFLPATDTHSRAEKIFSSKAAEISTDGSYLIFNGKVTVTGGAKKFFYETHPEVRKNPRRIFSTGKFFCQP
ncbi:MAG: hypothetical protein IJR52_09350 [Selenomonadaceae bacterium]|nr:hypothetical protein [Selenomonadaceae bacterium]MBQ9497761.1 hypothetical protein [Selenomonadaceae bacterium]